MPTTEIVLPVPHTGQIKAMKALYGQRFKSIRCGRRWGKSALGSILGCDVAVKRGFVGIFAPDYRILSETYNEIETILNPIKSSSNKIEGVIRLKNGGRIDFWTLNNPRAGRSRQYDLVILDEVAFAGPDMRDIWEKSIRPTLLDRRGGAIALSTPNGKDEENFFYQICNDKSLGWAEFHAPTHQNPFLPADELEKLEKDNMPLVYQQEYLAEFVSWEGASFFPESSLLVDGVGVEYPFKCDQVFAVIDSALKDGQEHDGTAVTYFAKNKFAGIPLTILDWDIIQVQGAILEHWLPSVIQRCEDLARELKARQGAVGIWIEDKASGIILLQQGQKRGWPVFPIESKLTDLGKEARALSVSGYVFRSDVKISKYAHEKVVVYKNQSRNHFLSQVCGFRMGQKNAADDLLDTFTYGIALGLGNAEGY